MRIAQVCPLYTPHIGGVESHVRQISERLAKRGFIVEILTTDPAGGLPSEEVINDVRVRRFKSWAPREAYYFSSALKSYLMKNQDYDVVHAHNYHAFPALYAAQAKKRNRLIFTPRYHGSGHTFLRNLLHIPYKILGQKIFDKSDQIICLTPNERALVLSRFRTADDKLTVVPNGINKAEFIFTKVESGKLSKILTVSRLEKYKGLEYLLEALAKLDGDVSLDIVGKGPYEKELLRHIDRLGLEGRVALVSDLSRQDLLRLYAQADVFVMLSRHEAFGNVIAEALTSGTTSIVANVPALSHWIDNRNCFGIDYPVDIDKLARLMRTVAGKKTETANLDDWDDTVDKLEVIYMGKRERLNETMSFLGDKAL